MEKEKKKIKIIIYEVFDDDFNIKLDSITSYYNKNLLVKIDVEGNELNVLEGMVKILSQNKLITLLVCTYHKQNDEVILNDFLIKVSTIEFFLIYFFARHCWEMKTSYLLIIFFYFLN